jgi:hypothetical protein
MGPALASPSPSIGQKLDLQALDLGMQHAKEPLMLPNMMLLIQKI